MGLGKKYVAELRKLIKLPHSRLHNDHQYCRACKAGPFATIEEIVDHVGEHKELLNCQVVPLDSDWVVLIEPHERYRRNQGKGRTSVDIPASVKRLPTIQWQVKELGIDPNWLANKR
jgi:hypothetical protein